MQVCLWVWPHPTNRGEGDTKCSDSCCCTRRLLPQSDPASANRVGGSASALRLPSVRKSSRVLRLTAMPLDPSKRSRAVTTPLGLSFRIAPSAATTWSEFCRRASCSVTFRTCHRVLRSSTDEQLLFHDGLPQALHPDSRWGLLGLPTFTFSSGG